MAYSLGTTTSKESNLAVPISSPCIIQQEGMVYMLSGIGKNPKLDFESNDQKKLSRYSAGLWESDTLAFMVFQ